MSKLFLSFAVMHYEGADFLGIFNCSEKAIDLCEKTSKTKSDYDEYYVLESDINSTVSKVVWEKEITTPQE